MITLYDMLPLLSAGIGIGIGIVIGKPFGSLWAEGGAIIGLLAGGLLGLFIRRLLLHYEARSARRKMAAFSNEELKAELHSFRHFTPNVVLAELRARGEDISVYLDYVLDLLQSESELARAFGWGAFRTAFPERVRLLLQIDYNPNAKPAVCRDKIAMLRKAIDQENPLAS